MCAVVVLPLALVAVGSGGGANAATVTPITLIAPSNLPGVPALPFTGTTAAAFTVPATAANLTVTPNQGVSGTPMTITGTGLAANTSAGADLVDQRRDVGR